MSMAAYENGELITINEAIDETGRCRKVLNTWIKEGIITLHKVNGARMVSKKQVILIHKSKRRNKAKKHQRIIDAGGNEIITRSDAMKLTGLSEHTIRKWISDGDISDYREKGHSVLDPVLVSRKEIREMQAKMLARAKKKSTKSSVRVVEIGKESLAGSLIVEKIRELEKKVSELEARLEKAEATTQRVFGFAKRLSNIERAIVEASETVQGPKGEIRQLL